LSVILRIGAKQGSARRRGGYGQLTAMFNATS